MKRRFLLSLGFVMVAVVTYAQVTVTPQSAVIDVGQTVPMSATGASFYIWSPTQWLTDTVGPSTTAAPLQTTVYTVSGYEPGEDKVVNGDFEMGDDGFDSDYQANDDLWGEGTYCVDTDASLHHSSFHGLGHGGTGNFLIVNGGTIPGTTVWSEQISVTPNKYYAFTVWVCSLHQTNLARLQFSINGEQIGDVFEAPPPPLVPGMMNDVWEAFYQIWYSGSATSATITILNQNTDVEGNDFGLDDISFCEMVLSGTAQCTITIDNLAANDDIVNTCYGQAIEVPFSANDQIPPDCSDMSCHIVAEASNGTAVCENGQMLYTPNEGFFGSDQFRYRVQCGVLSAEATVSVTVWPEYSETLQTSACNTFSWHGVEFDKSIDTVWVKQGVAEHGCDSVLDLHLTVYYNDTITIQRTSCEPYEWHGDFYATTDVYEYWTTNEHGCDRLELLNLTMSSEFYGEETLSECDSYFWPRKQQWYYESTTDTLVVEGQQGLCDSVFVLNLTVKKNSFDTIYRTVCRGYEWHEHEYAEAGIYHYPPLVPDTCLHYEVLNLTIRDTDHLGAISGPASVYVSSGVINGIYRYEIDTTEIEGGIEWSVSNNWVILETDANSCRLMVTTPETATLKAVFSLPGCGTFERTFAINAVFYGVDELAATDVRVFPNPSGGQFAVEAECIKRVRVSNMLGQVLAEVEGHNANQLVLQIGHLGQSVCLLEIDTGRGKAFRKIVMYK